MNKGRSDHGFEEERCISTSIGRFSPFIRLQCWGVVDILGKLQERAGQCGGKRCSKDNVSEQQLQAALNEAEKEWASGLQI
jgi:hypothetical protein